MMRLSTIIKLLVFLLALAGIINLYLNIPDTQNLTDPLEVYSQLNNKQTITLFTGVVSVIALLFLIMLSLIASEGKRFYKEYSGIDSDVLDKNKRKAREFYQSALDYRISHGRFAYKKCILDKFNFLYEYHNYALKWIDDSVSHFNRNQIPKNFILSVIESGHIGRINTRARYASGLPAGNQKTGAPLLFHDCAKGIQIWSYDSHKPLCEISKKSVNLQPTHRHPNYLSAILTGKTTDQNAAIQIELRFLTSTGQNKHAHHSESQARKDMQEMTKWLKEVNACHSRHKLDTGIDVTEIPGIQSIFKTPLNQKLEQLVYRKVDAFYPRSKLPITDPDIAIDAVVLCKGVGILLVTEKHEQGDITYSGNADWYQYLNGDGFSLNNPCLQSNRAKASLANLLTTHHLTKWPVISVVVFSKDNVTLNPAFGKTRVQCDVIRLNQMEKWIDSLPKSDNILFTQHDISRFNDIMSSLMTRNSLPRNSSSDALLNQV